MLTVMGAETRLQCSVHVLSRHFNLPHSHFYFMLLLLYLSIIFLRLLCALQVFIVLTEYFNYSYLIHNGAFIAFNLSIALFEFCCINGKKNTFSLSLRFF